MVCIQVLILIGLISWQNLRMRKYLSATMLGFILLFLGFVLGTWHQENSSQPAQEVTSTKVSPREIRPLTASVIVASQPRQLYEVVSVVDGDTIDILLNGEMERLRLIGINTPETVDPRKSVECFGREASEKAKSILSGRQVALEDDSSQGERDKYGRLLRYVFFEDGTNFNLLMIQEGYAYEYTHDLPYRYQTEFKQAQKEAEKNKMGLWGNPCQNKTEVAPAAPAAGACVIKGNINAKKEKIYHVPGCGSYDKTVIDESNEEKWFCSEQDALDAGWRKALNC